MSLGGYEGGVGASSAQSVSPVGVVQIWMTDTAPVGWLICSGQAVSRVSFAALFGVLGVAYGNGDGSTTFNLPDMRGEFVRGRDNAAGSDPDAGSRTDRGDSTTGDSVGTKQLGDFASHSHVIQMDLHDSTGTLADSLAANQGISAFTANKALATGGNETRGRNIGVNFIIRTQ